jgi:hypothetical protein
MFKFGDTVFSTVVLTRTDPVWGKCLETFWLSYGEGGLHPGTEGLVCKDASRGPIHPPPKLPNPKHWHHWD